MMKDALGMVPVYSTVVLLLLSCVCMALPSPWSYIALFLVALPLSVFIGWYIATNGGRNE